MTLLELILEILLGFILAILFLIVAIYGKAVLDEVLQDTHTP